MRSLTSLLLLTLCFVVRLATPSPSRDLHLRPGDDEFDDDDDDDDFLPTRNGTAEGTYVDAPCDTSCSPSLHHVVCQPETKRCECDKKYPVNIGSTKGCAKPKRLGEQCFYTNTCEYSDQFSSCVQVNHNAICKCKTGYHRVSLEKPNRRTFCAADVVLLTKNLSALGGVAMGIAILAGLICFVLRLFSSARYSQPRHYANANMPPPILFSSDTGIPLTSNNSGMRSTSRSSQRSAATIASGYSRRTSSAQGGSRGVLVPASRAGAARAAAILLISCHVNSAKTNGSATPLPEYDDENAEALREPPLAVSEPASPPEPDSETPRIGSRRPSLASVHSAGSLGFGSRKLEKEREQKEMRQEMQVRLSRMGSLPANLPKAVPTPSPLSTDELLPSVSELKEIFTTDLRDTRSLRGEIGPCSSKDIL